MIAMRALKHSRAAVCLRDLWDCGAGRLSTQVLQEFYVNVTRKIPRPLNGPAAREIVRNYACWLHSAITPATVIRASEISELCDLSFWDGMILAAAEQIAATELLTEDLNHGQIVAGVRIRNPFLAE